MEVFGENRNLLFNFLSQKHSIMNFFNYKTLRKIIVLSLFLNLTFNAFSQNYQLVWSDEFDYTGLPNTDKWGYDVGGTGWGNGELQYYTSSRLENARVENGNLVIEAKLESYGGCSYTSARLVTRGKGDWLYGKIEVRAKLPSGKGSWPAIWMLPTDWEYGGWPSSGEIDIMEHVGYDETTIYGTVHTSAYNHTLGTQVGSNTQVADCETEFHVYAIEWDEYRIKFYVDDTRYLTFYNQNTWETWPFDKRFHLILNIAVGGSWGGSQGVDNSIFPTSMLVDYVRVYQDITSSVSDISKDDDILKIYPQPASDFINVKIPSDFISNNNYNIQITSSDGKNIQNLTVESTNSLQLDVSSYKSGVYFISINNNKQTITSKFIVK